MIIKTWNCIHWLCKLLKILILYLWNGELNKYYNYVEPHHWWDCVRITKKGFPSKTHRVNDVRHLCLRQCNSNSYISST